LYRPAGPDRDGFLVLGQEDGSELAVPLPAAKARLLAALAEALREDADLVWPVRGWRRPERLASCTGPRRGRCWRGAASGSATASSCRSKRRQ
jgi:hypothetical protein